MIKYLKKIFNTKKEKSSQEFFSDDIFIVSYPKSGNTWMRFLLANLMTDEEINFHSAVKFIPDFEVHKDELKKVQRPRLLKSHSNYDKHFSKVIYIVRDPRDVYVSYYHYLKKKLQKEDSEFSSFLRKPDLYPSRWHHHVQSWVDNKRNDFLLIRYEDLLSNTEKELTKVIQFLGWEKSEKELKRAVNNSSFSQMSKLEDTKGRPFKTKEDEAQSSKFVRSGKSGDWKSTFSSDDLIFLKEECGEISSKFGYEIRLESER